VWSDIKIRSKPKLGEELFNLTCLSSPFGLPKEQNYRVRLLEPAFSLLQGTCIWMIKEQGE
jgi:hypothetical protein